MSARNQSSSSLLLLLDYCLSIDHHSRHCSQKFPSRKSLMCHDGREDGLVLMQRLSHCKKKKNPHRWFVHLIIIPISSPLQICVGGGGRGRGGGEAKEQKEVTTEAVVVTNLHIGSRARTTVSSICSIRLKMVSTCSRKPMRLHSISLSLSPWSLRSMVILL